MSNKVQAVVSFFLVGFFLMLISLVISLAISSFNKSSLDKNDTKSSLDKNDMLFDNEIENKKLLSIPVPEGWPRKLGAPACHNESWKNGEIIGLHETKEEQFLFFDGKEIRLKTIYPRYFFLIKFTGEFSSEIGVIESNDGYMQYKNKKIGDKFIIQEDKK